MNKYERIDNVQEAEEKINEAIRLITDAVRGTSEEGMTMAYTVGHLNTWIGNGNPYDHHTGKIIEGLEEWDEIEEGQAYCESCDQVKDQDLFFDEDICEKCHEDKASEAEWEKDHIKHGRAE